MKRFKKDFASKLVGIDFETLEKNNNSIFGLSKDLKLIYFNPSWIGFAEENDPSESLLKKHPLGTSIEKSISGEEIKSFYIQNYKNVLKTGKVWRHEYECSSPNESRIYHQGAYPLKNGEGLIIINTLVVKLSMDDVNRKSYKANKKQYLDSNGFINQCSNCRNSQRANQPEVWDWVPAWIEDMPENVSHTICPTCFDYYWKYNSIKYTSSNKK